MRYVVRLWLPDRPGALGRVATALGSVDASLVGIDILEQGGGWAIDELVVDLAGQDERGGARGAATEVGPADQLTAALHLVDGVKVESIHPTSGVVDPRVDALETAAELVGQRSQEDLLQVLVGRVVHDLAAEWAVVLRRDDDEVLHVAGPSPSPGWLRAFVEGAKSLSQHDTGFAGPEDIAWADLPVSALILLLGRTAQPFRSRERQQLSALARIADQRFVDVA